MPGRGPVVPIGLQRNVRPDPQVYGVAPVGSDSLSSLGLETVYRLQRRVLQSKNTAGGLWFLLTNLEVSDPLQLVTFAMPVDVAGMHLAAVVVAVAEKHHLLLEYTLPGRRDVGSNWTVSVDSASTHMPANSH